MFNLKQFSLSAATIAATVTLSTVCSTPAQAATLHTTDFIPNTTRTNFNGFEGLPDSYNYGSVYTEDGIKVEQVNGDQNGIATLYLGWGSEGQKSWYPWGGDNGFTKITRQDSSDFLNLGLLRGSGYSYGSPTPITYVYQLLKNGSNILSGNLFSDFSGYIGFSGGGFDEVRLGAYYGNNPSQTLSGFQALAIDSIELSGSPQAIPTPALLPGLIGLGLGVWRKRKANQAQAVLEEQKA